MQTNNIQIIFFRGKSTPKDVEKAKKFWSGDAVIIANKDKQESDTVLCEYKTPDVPCNVFICLKNASATDIGYLLNVLLNSGTPIEVELVELTNDGIDSFGVFESKGLKNAQFEDAVSRMLTQI